MIVVAPALNLSGTEDLDPLRITDAIASEFLSFENVTTIPVNLVLAALARKGTLWVESPAAALELAQEFGADATVVTAITEYNPYDPPVVGMVMQWYGRNSLAERRGLDPVAASRAAGEPQATLATDASRPQVQIQRVFRASDKDVLQEIQLYAKQHPGHESPYGYKKFTKSQELYVRYCAWSLIRSILQVQDSQGAAMGDQRS